MTIDEHHQHKDVYRHSLTVLEQAVDLEDEGPDLVLRWAALLHDIGKPATRRHEEGGGVSFHHHEVVGAKMVRKRMRALSGTPIRHRRGAAVAAAAQAGARGLHHA
ncbi:CCA tRNA nucleotidyltransferase [Mycobacteroides abscessus subsp. massiliense]|nr:CCA tRNA nucleotidyltransferase [Mycobacteroides abscessus subsp. massiliense]